ncbi:ATP synthase subunit I [Oceanobacillus piezotolerans]|uniref:ATP synthase subunit I n=1 Tax=Oceanobacillus piezotolerans TaxID=2448030 RepID=A0A498D6W9_9BACI|nr:ATP synthase subunit I [Oceanobacillus piezotolerans]RLL42904.1 ATP synthase subunit I [Oceanobacillus piezotolerans]
MSDFENMIIRQRKWMLYLLAVLVLGTVFTSHPRIFNSLLLGASVSFYNLWLLQHKTNAFGKTVAETGKARGGLGTFSRLAASILAVLIALRFEETFHIIAVVIGIVSSYFIMALDGIVQFIKHNKSKNPQ